MTPFNLYLLLKLNAIIGLFAATAAIFIVAIIVLLVILSWSYASNPKESQKTKKSVYFHFAYMIPITIISILCASLIPSTGEMATIVVVPKICNAVQNNKEAMALPGEVVGLASDWIKALRPERFFQDSTGTTK
jgi:heme/copper-type cytochrome/quinol oxidase subunit 2